jgi:hypothetical protein
MNINITAFDPINRTITANVLADDNTTELVPALTINGLDISLCMSKDLLIAYLSDVFRSAIDNINAANNTEGLLDPSTVIGKTSAIMTTDDAMTARSNVAMAASIAQVTSVGIMTNKVG